MRSSLFYHLEEIRLRFIYILISFFFTFCVASYFSYELIYLLVRSHKDKLIFTYISEAFFTDLKICFTVGLVCIIPLAIYHVSCFLRPSYFESENKPVVSFFRIGFILFILSHLFFYFILIPLCYHFFSGYQIDSQFLNVELQARIESYMSFVFILYSISFCLGHIPLLFSFLFRLNLISISFLSTNRSIFFLLFLLLAAFISPPDIVSQMVCACCLFLYYELLVLFACILYHKQCHFYRIKTKS